MQGGVHQHSMYVSNERVWIHRNDNQFVGSVILSALKFLALSQQCAKTSLKCIILQRACEFLTLRNLLAQAQKQDFISECLAGRRSAIVFFLLLFCLLEVMLSH